MEARYQEVDSMSAAMTARMPQNLIELRSLPDEFDLTLMQSLMHDCTIQDIIAQP